MACNVAGSQAPQPAINALAIVGSSKSDVQRLLRRLVVDGILLEDTFRQDNQYASVNSCLLVAEPAAARLTSGALRITLPFLTKARL